MEGGEKGMNSVLVATINPRKEYWPSRDCTIDHLLSTSLVRFRLIFRAIVTISVNHEYITKCLGGILIKGGFAIDDLTDYQTINFRLF